MDNNWTILTWFELLAFDLESILDTSGLLPYITVYTIKNYQLFRFLCIFDCFLNEIQRKKVLLFC